MGSSSPPAAQPLPHELVLIGSRSTLLHVTAPSDYTLPMLQQQLARHYKLNYNSIAIQPFPGTETTTWCSDYHRLQLSFTDIPMSQLSFVQILQIRRFQRLVAAIDSDQQPAAEFSIKPQEAEAGADGVEVPRQPQPAQSSNALRHLPRDRVNQEGGAASGREGPLLPLEALRLPDPQQPPHQLPEPDADLSPTFYREHVKIHLKCFPRGRRTYTLWAPKQEELSWLRQEFARISKRAFHSFVFMRENEDTPLDEQRLCACLEHDQQIRVLSQQCPHLALPAAQGGGREQDRTPSTTPVLPSMYNEAIAKYRAVDAKQRTLSNLQLKAILRATPTCAKKVATCDKDEQVIAILLAQARKMGITPQSPTPGAAIRASTPAASSLSGPHASRSSSVSSSARTRSKSVHFESEEDEEDFQPVRARRNSSRGPTRPHSPLRWGWPKPASQTQTSAGLASSVHMDGKTTSTASTPSSATAGSSPTWSLVKQDWKVPIVTSFKMGESGVMFCPDQSLAEQLLPGVRASQTPFVLLTPKKLDQDTSQEIMFRIKRDQDDVCDARVLHGPAAYRESWTLRSAGALYP